jgi:hypothetical protein
VEGRGSSPEFAEALERNHKELHKYRSQKLLNPVLVFDRFPVSMATGMPTALTDILGFPQTLKPNACIVQLIPILSQINPVLFLPHVLTSLGKQETGTQMMRPKRHPETSVNFNQFAPPHGQKHLILICITENEW